MTRTNFSSAHLRWCKRPPGFAGAILFVFFAAPSWGRPVEQGLQAVIYPEAFTFAADQLTAAPFVFGPYDLNTDYECYRRLDVEDFNLTVEIASAAVTMERDTLSLDVALGTVRGTDIDVSGVSGFLDLCLDFDASIEYVQLIDGRFHGTLEATANADGSGVTLGFVGAPELTGTFDSQIDWFPDDIVWAFFGDLVLEEVGTYLAGALPALLEEPIGGVLDTPFGAFEVEAVVSDVGSSRDGLSASVDVDLGGEGDREPPTLDLEAVDGSHLAVGLTDGVVRDVVAIAFANGLLDEDSEVTASLLADLIATLGVPSDVTTTLAVASEPQVAIDPDGVGLVLDGTTFEVWSGDQRLLRMVFDVNAVLGPEFEPGSATIGLTARRIDLAVVELDASGLVADPEGEEHLEAFLEGWVAEALTEAVQQVPLFGSRFELSGYVLRLDVLSLQDQGISAWFTLFDADDPAVDLIAPDTVVSVQDRVATIGGVDDRAGSLMYSWQVDGGGWSIWSDAVEAVLPALEPGEHTVEARSRDGWQNVDPTPATATFTIATEPVPTEPKGCGCAGIGPGSAGWLGMLAWAVTRRRSRALAPPG